MEDLETKAMLDAMDDDQKGSKKFWAPTEGENQIRFLPPLTKAKGEVLPYFHHKTHWIDGTPYECINQSLTDKHGNLHEAENCPFCKKSKQLYKIAEKDSEEWKLAGSLGAKDRYIYRIIDRKAKEPTKPVFYETGPSIFKKFYTILKSQKYGNIVHPVDGRDFIIDMVGKGSRANYDNSMPGPDKEAIFSEPDKMREVLKNAATMEYSALIEFPSYEECDRALKEYLAIDEEEKPAAKPAQKATAKPAAKADDDEDDDDTTTSSSAKTSGSADDAEIDKVLEEFEF